MCGITGILAFNLIGKFNKIHVTAATQALARRGPDFQQVYDDEWVGLGHRRLSIIDTRDVANQPMWDESHRYALIFNGEIFNYRELRHDLERRGESFFSQSDTEVLLKILIREGSNALPKLNGFFAFCLYDKQDQTMLLARDRFGIKPLLYSFDDDKFIFASEMKSVLKYGIEKDIDFASLATYLHLNYIPAPDSILKQVHKLMPGCCMKVGRKHLEIESYYQLPAEDLSNPLSYSAAQGKLAELLEESVKRRLVADVPLGAFLSGGVDSSVIAALAAKHKPDIHTFSIGFRDEPFFDETEYAREVSSHLNTDHTVFSLTHQDLYSHMHEILDYIDEPFADSSALAVFILSKETRRHATVALSGDGADELLGGYNKHSAFYRYSHPGWQEKIAVSLAPLWRSLPASRNGTFANKVRQLQKFAAGARLTPVERYWRLAGFTQGTEALSMLIDHSFGAEVQRRKQELLKDQPGATLNSILRADMQIVLPNDMLTKVDLMSMANGLEVRVPFLDVTVVDFISKLPDTFKINGNLRKRILQDTFRTLLPASLYNRPKKGFEVPLLKWFRGDMRTLIEKDLLSEEFVRNQNVFNYSEIESLKKQLFSSNPGDSHARIWALIVFQWWWKKYFR